MSGAKLNRIITRIMILFMGVSHVMGAYGRGQRHEWDALSVVSFLVAILTACLVVVLALRGLRAYREGHP